MGGILGRLPARRVRFFPDMSTRIPLARTKTHVRNVKNIPGAAAAATDSEMKGQEYVLSASGPHGTSRRINTVYST